MVDCGVNLADSFSEFIGCQSIVFAESILKINQLVLEVGYIDVLSKNKYQKGIPLYNKEFACFLLSSYLRPIFYLLVQRYKIFSSHAIERPIFLLRKIKTCLLSTDAAVLYLLWWYG